MAVVARDEWDFLASWKERGSGASKKIKVPGHSLRQPRGCEGDHAAQKDGSRCPVGVPPSPSPGAQSVPGWALSRCRPTPAMIRA